MVWCWLHLREVVGAFNHVYRTVCHALDRSNPPVQNASLIEQDFISDMVANEAQDKLLATRYCLGSLLNVSPIPTVVEL